MDNSAEKPMNGMQGPEQMSESGKPMRIIFSILKYLFLVLVVTTVIGTAVVGTFLYQFSRGLPEIITIEDYKPLTVTKILGKGDVPVGEFYEERRYVIPYEEIPELLVHAFTAAEDDRFFEHQGVDLQGIVRAAIVNFKAGRVVQGGSTITQQVAKSLLLTPERSFVRKIKEVILAYRMEKNLNKKQILFLYLNQIYLGQGAYGVEAASQIYFGKHVKDITIAEAAILAGLPQAPSKYSPLLNPKKAKERQLYVLRRLVEDGIISAEKMDQASKEPIRIYLAKEINETYAPYYVETVRKYLLDKYGKDVLYRGGLTVQTPIDPILGKVATVAVQEGLRAVDKKQGYRGPIKKHKNNEEIDLAIAEAEEYNVTKRHPYKLMLADGSFARDFKQRMYDVAVPIDAFDENEIYQAVVLSVDDKKREALVSLGPIKGVITFEKMAWATPLKSIGNGTIAEPLKKPSQILSKGDLIWVRLAAKTGGEGGVPILGLEQEPAVQGALLSMDVSTGEVLSMVGGFDYKQSEFNRAIQAERQPGSSYKPIIYAAAMEKGYTPSTIIQDSPIVFAAGENEKWKPANFEEKFYGDTTFRSALVRSRNVPTIKIVQDIQIPYLVEFSKRLGIVKNLNPDLSISLGSSTISLLDLAKVYAIFPRGGRKVNSIMIRKVSDREGKVLEETVPTPAPAANELAMPEPPRPVQVAGELQSEAASGMTDVNQTSFVSDPQDPDRVLDSRVAYVMTHLMNEVATVGTGAGAKNLGRTAAGKTGTTNDYLDAWFMGFTPNVVTGVWIGFDSQKSLGPKSTGGLVALPIWLEFMKEAVKAYPESDFAPPKGVSFVFVDAKTGKIVPANRPNAVREAFLEGTEPGSRKWADSAVRLPPTANADGTGGAMGEAGAVNGASSPTPGRVLNAPPPNSGGSGDDDTDQQFFKEDF